MAGDRPRSAEESISADLIAQRGFSTAFRGFDTAEVKAFLSQVAAEVRLLRQQQADLQAALAAAEDRAAHPRLDEETLTAAVGEETKAILRAARTAATDIRTQAEETASGHVSEGQERADLLRAEAEAILSIRTDEAEAAAAEIRAEALRETTELREKAQSEAEAVTAKAEQDRRETVERAQAHRDKILGDLGRRRKLAATQIEQLRAGRDRLLEAYRVVRQTLDDVSAELQRSDAEARAAAEAAARRPLPTEALQDPPEDGTDLHVASETEDPLTLVDGPSGLEVLGVEDGAETDTDQPTVIDEVVLVTASVTIVEATGETEQTEIEQSQIEQAEIEQAEVTATEGRSEVVTPSESAGPAVSETAGSTVPDAAVVSALPVDQAGTVAGSEASEVADSPALDPATSETEPVTAKAGTGKPVLSESAGSKPGAKDDAAAAATSGPGTPSRRRSRTKPDPGATPAAVSPKAAQPAAPESNPEASPDGPTAPRRRRRTATEAATVTRPAGDVLVVESSKASLVAELIEEPTGARPRRPPTQPSPDAAGEDLDEIFARIRADRAQSVAHARDVLATPAPTVAPSHTPSPDAAAVVEVLGEASANGTIAPVAGTDDTGTDDTEVDRAETDDVEVPISNADEALLQRRDGATAIIESTLARRLKRALQDEQNDLLDRLRGFRGKVTEAALLPSPNEQAERFAIVSRPLLDEAARAGASFIRVALRGSDGQSAPEPASSGDLPELSVLADELAAAVATPLRRRLELAFADGQDEDPTVLAEALGAAYREWKTQRIERTAGDHVAGAFSRGAYAATPKDTPLRWLVEDLDGPCPDCDDNTLAGSIPRGEPFPTGQIYPPAHPGCRCLLIPG